jgi:hypothetical protein
VHGHNQPVATGTFTDLRFLRIRLDRLSAIDLVLAH